MEPIEAAPVPDPVVGAALFSRAAALLAGTPRDADAAAVLIDAAAEAAVVAPAAAVVSAAEVAAALPAGRLP